MDQAKLTMTLLKQIAKHFRDVYFGTNWTSVNFKDTLADIRWQDAMTKVHNFNTIAALVFHINYYVNPVLKVLKGEPLIASDKFSFDLPPVTSAYDWQQLVTKVFGEAELFALQIEQLDESKLFEDFEDQQYGNVYSNLHGIIEHTYYHLGQISLIKIILNETKTSNQR